MCHIVHTRLRLRHHKYCAEVLSFQSVPSRQHKTWLNHYSLVAWWWPCQAFADICWYAQTDKTGVEREREREREREQLLPLLILYTREHARYDWYRYLVNNWLIFSSFLSLLHTWYQVQQYLVVSYYE